MHFISQLPFVHHLLGHRYNEINISKTEFTQHRNLPYLLYFLCYRLVHYALNQIRSLEFIMISPPVCVASQNSTFSVLTSISFLENFSSPCFAACLSLSLCIFHRIQITFSASCPLSLLLSNWILQYCNSIFLIILLSLSSPLIVSRDEHQQKSCRFSPNLCVHYVFPLSYLRTTIKLYLISDLPNRNLVSKNNCCMGKKNICSTAIV